MVREIKWSKKADKDFDKIIEYLEVEWDSKVTFKFIQKVYSTVELLLLFPLIGSRTSLDKDIRGILITEHTRLYYRVKNNVIIILKLFDTRQNPMRLKL